jgi:hypothetical protein
MKATLFLKKKVPNPISRPRQSADAILWALRETALDQVYWAAGRSWAGSV